MSQHVSGCYALCRLNTIQSYVYIHSSADVRLGGVHLLAIVNNDAMSLDVHIAPRVS